VRHYWPGDYKNHSPIHFTQRRERWIAAGDSAIIFLPFHLSAILARQWRGMTWSARQIPARGFSRRRRAMLLLRGNICEVEWNRSCKMGFNPVLLIDFNLKEA
jgi:hypothetical protein